jgi:hypothetical protein
MSAHTIALQLQDRSPRATLARQYFVAALGEVVATEPDETGCFEVVLNCGSQDEALQLVWDAVATSGADDHLVIMEFPHIERHWEHRAERPKPG